MSNFQTTSCRSCGEPVIWVVLPSGKKCPVDAKQYNMATHTPGNAPVYSLEHKGGDVVAVKLDKATLGSLAPFYVSHFGTCPNAGQHSKK